MHLHSNEPRKQHKPHSPALEGWDLRSAVQQRADIFPWGEASAVNWLAASGSGHRPLCGELDQIRRAADRSVWRSCMHFHLQCGETIISAVGVVCSEAFTSSSRLSEGTLPLSLDTAYMGFIYTVYTHIYITFNPEPSDDKLILWYAVTPPAPSSFEFQRDCSSSSVKRSTHYRHCFLAYVLIS